MWNVMVQTWPCNVRKFASNNICLFLRQPCFNTNACPDRVTVFQHNPLREMGNAEKLLETVGEKKSHRKWVVTARGSYCSCTWSPGIRSVFLLYGWAVLSTAKLWALLKAFGYYENASKNCAIWPVVIVVLSDFVLFPQVLFLSTFLSYVLVTVTITVIVLAGLVLTAF